MWQLSIFRTDLEPTHNIRLSGLHSQARFVYFLYYQNLFPVATLESGRDWEFYYTDAAVPVEPNRLAYNKDAARRIIAEKGSSLVQEWGHTIRWGNYLETYLFLVDAWRLGSPEHAEARIAGTLAFMLALAAVYAAFLLVGRGTLGVILVLLLGSNPFQMFAAYRENNVKSWPITMFCVAVALLAPLIAGKKIPLRGRVVLAVVIGLLFGTAYQIRSETAAAMLGSTVVFMTASGASWRSRVATTVLVFATFAGALAAWHAFFEHKIAEATQVVTRAGGHPYPGPLNDAHNLWTSLWSGLGDFDTKYGYASTDHGAVIYAEPVLRSRYGQELSWWWGISREKQGRIASDYYDADHLYYRAPFEAPHFQEVMRDKVIHDITHDPLWYGAILAKRAWRILNQTTPVQFFLRPGLTVPVPFHGLVALAILAIAAWLRDWTGLRLLVMAFSLSAMAFVVNAGGNYTYFGTYHVCAAAIGLSWIVSRVSLVRR